MDPEIWRKALIITSQYPTLEMREVWALSNRPQERDIVYKDGRPTVIKRFYILNLIAPGEKAPLGICEDEMRWLKRGTQDVMLFTPPMVPAAVWANPSWTGL